MSQLIKVLLIEDNRIEARQAQQWLATASIPFAVEWVDRLSLGLDRLARGGVDIVLSDLNLPDSRGLATFDQVRERAPMVPVVVLTGEDDEALGAMAVERGAQDYLVKGQVDGTKLARVLRFAVTRHRARVDQVQKVQDVPAAKVIGFLGVKGGVGTTTVALNVASALAKKQKTVIVAELRPWFGTMAFQLRQEPAGSLRSLSELPPERIDERELGALLCKGPAGSRILFGPRPGDLPEEIDPGRAEAVVKGLARMAEYVILDLPSQPSAATQAVARLCQFVALVTEREPGSVLCGKVATKLLQSWGVGGELVGAVVVNRAEVPMSMNLMEVRSHLGCELVGVVLAATLACIRAQDGGAPLVLSQPDHGAAIALVDLANRIAADNVVGIRF